MEKQFYPNIEFNRKRRTKLLVFYVLLFILAGGFGVFLFATNQPTIGIMMLGILVMLGAMVPSGLAQYPVKHKPLITIDGKNVVFGANEVVNASQILAVSICIEVPTVSKLESENREFLQKVASQRPNEPVLGACDVTMRNQKGKEIIKYAIIDDCIGALEEFLNMGVKKYRILYSQKRNTEEAKYKMVKQGEKEETLATLSEREKLEQIF